MRVTSKLCMAKDLGVNGNLFGGNMMCWIDIIREIQKREVK
jgi:acyl-CoA hydrolase